MLCLKTAYGLCHMFIIPYLKKQQIERLYPVPAFWVYDKYANLLGLKTLFTYFSVFLLHLWLFVVQNQSWHESCNTRARVIKVFVYIYINIHILMLYYTYILRKEMSTFL